MFRKILMMRFLKVIVLGFLINLCAVSAHAEVKKSGDTFNWESVMAAIIHLESRGNAKAVNGQYAGILQISPILVKECNNILKARGSKKRYKLSDRFNVQKSKEMFVLIQSFHNPMNNIERGIRLWAGGIQYSIGKTQSYLGRVLSIMK